MFAFYGLQSSYLLAAVFHVADKTELTIKRSHTKAPHRQARLCLPLRQWKCPGGFFFFHAPLWRRHAGFLNLRVKWEHEKRWQRLVNSITWFNDENIYSPTWKKKMKMERRQGRCVWGMKNTDPSWWISRGFAKQKLYQSKSLKMWAADCRSTNGWANYTFFVWNNKIKRRKLILHY